MTNSNITTQQILSIISPVSVELRGSKCGQETRVSKTIEALEKANIYAFYEGECPSSGMSFLPKKMKNGIRVNVRCGYGRHNYAPCVFIPLN